jgi:hypothetical protein
MLALRSVSNDAAPAVATAAVAAPAPAAVVAAAAVVVVVEITSAISLLFLNGAFHHTSFRS